MQDEPAIDYSQSGKCLNCGYLLRSLPEPRCPECGRAFDPFDPTTMDVPDLPASPRYRRPRSFGEEIITGAAAGLIFCGLGGWGSVPLAWLVGLTIWIGVIYAWIQRGRPNEPSPPDAMPDGFGWRWSVKCLLLASVAVSVRFHSCVHATTFSTGAIGISYSTQGGPCRNAPHAGGEHLHGNWYFATLR